MNVISPVSGPPFVLAELNSQRTGRQIITSPEGLFKQTTFYPLKLFSTLMRGSALDVHVDSSSYEGPTVPSFIQNLTLHTPKSAQLTKFVDVSAVLADETQEVRVAIVNRSESDDFETKIAFGPGAKVVGGEVKVFEVWSQSLEDSNNFAAKGGEKVKIEERVEKWDEGGVYVLKKHSFQGMLKQVIWRMRAVVNFAFGKSLGVQGSIG